MKEREVIESYEALAGAIFCMPVRATDIHKLKETADTLISRLPIGLPQYHSRNRAILRARFSLAGQPRGLAEIGDELGLYGKRTRQSESMALRMLRRPPRSRQKSELTMKRKSS